MNVGANFMREHVLDGTRIQYVITNGGQAANIVPETAAVHYIIRAEEADYTQEVMERLRNIARGAALMTDTTMEEKFESGFACMYANRYLADLMYSIMEKMDPIDFTKEELAFAQKINDAFGKSNPEYLEEKIENVKMSKSDAELLRQEADKPLLAKNYPPMDGNIVFKGATDVGDLSQVTPTAALWTACFPTCTPGHSWANVATSGMSIGHKGMLHGAKIVALTAAEMLLNQSHFDKAREEFNELMKGKKYQPLLPEGFLPPHREP
jgi:aminobenzoyl-glutamate utilization protein B